MDRENIPQKKKLTSANSSGVNLTALVSASTKMVRPTKANTKMICAVEKGYSLIRKGLSMRGTGLTTCSTVRALRHM